MIGIIILLVIILGTLKALQDTANFHFPNSILPSFFDNNKLWIWKYKDPADLSKGYKWSGLARYLTFIQDGWHLCDLLRIILSFVLCLLYTPVISPYIDIILGVIIHQVVFTILFDYILIK